MKRQIAGICVLMMVITGCDNFLGLEDYQRDILGVLIGRVGQQTVSDGVNCWDTSGEGMCDVDEDWTGPDGVPDEMCDAWDCQGRGIIGIAGTDGTDGSDGLNCWDMDASGVCDADDDWTGPDGEPDGICNYLDCQGPAGADGTSTGTQGPQGPAGPQGPSGTDGTDGTNGTDGTDGSNGLNCWDLNANFVCDLDAEDWNSPLGGTDGICDAWDCQGAPSGGDNCTTLCHCNNQGACHTVVVPAPAVKSHRNHGDACGPCDE
jgi:hypothetical protein